MIGVAVLSVTVATGLRGVPPGASGRRGCRARHQEAWARTAGQLAMIGFSRVAGHRTPTVCVRRCGG